LLAHPGFYEQIRGLDEKLTEMEHTGANETDYEATLARLVECIKDARAMQAREQPS
jgi:hypothetical protein